MKYIVCVTDNEASRAALLHASRLANHESSLVEVLHVLPPSDFQSLYLVADKMLEERRQEAEAMLAKLMDEVYRQTGIIPSIHIRAGNIGEEIAAVARASEPDTTLVLGNSPQAKGGLAAWLQAHQGDKFTLPVLLVPTKRQE